MWTNVSGNSTPVSAAGAVCDTIAICREVIHMLKRILTAAVALCLFVPVLVFSETWAFPILFALCALIGVFELLRCVGLHRNPWIAVPLCLLALAAPLGVRYALVNRGAQEGTVCTVALGTILLLVVYLLGVAVLDHKRTDITSVCTVFAVFLYTAGGFAGVVCHHGICRRVGDRHCCILFRQTVRKAQADTGSQPQENRGGCHRRNAGLHPGICGHDGAV